MHIMVYVYSPNVDIRFEYNQQLTELSKMCSDYKAQIELKNSALIGQHLHRLVQARIHGQELKPSCCHCK